MRSIKKIAVTIFLGLAVVIGVEAAARLCYEKWSTQTIFSKQERRELNGTLDTLYLGTSLVYRGFDPMYLDEQLGTNSFNLATAGQTSRGIYYMLRETAENNPVEKVYLTFSLALLKKEDNTEAHLSAFENMLSWKWKLAYLADVNERDVWLNGLLYSTRVKNYLNPSYVKTNLKHKLITHKKPKTYVGRGYRSKSFRTYEGGEYDTNQDRDRWYAELGESQVQPDALKYLEKIAEFCREEDIELIGILTPCTQDYLDGAGDYDAFHDYVEGWCLERGAEFYDFSYYKERLELFTDDMFVDDKHLNYPGGTRFSEVLAKVMKSENPEEYFYESLADFEQREEEQGG